MSVISATETFSSSPWKRKPAVAPSSVESTENQLLHFLNQHEPVLNLEHHLLGAERNASFPTTSLGVAGHDLALQSNQHLEPLPFSMEQINVDLNGVYYNNGLISSSPLAIFDAELKLSSNDIRFGQSINAPQAGIGEDEPSESLEELEAQTIGNLLPVDDDDLLFGVTDACDYLPRPISGEDLFCSGELELEAVDGFHCYKTTKLLGVEMFDDQDSDPLGGEHPFGELPSRTLFVRNINSNDQNSELMALFEPYGDICALNIHHKHHGFVMVSYYDIRAAENAMAALRNKPPWCRKLDIHFFIPKENLSEKGVNQGTLMALNLDSSISYDELEQIFGAYGEIKEIRESLDKQHHKLIEFYDVRAAEAALLALNKSDIGGKRITLEFSRLAYSRQCLMHHLSPKIDREVSSGCRSGGTSNNSSSECEGSIPLWTNISNHIENGIIQDLHLTLRRTFDRFMEPSFNGLVSTVGPVGNHRHHTGHIKGIHSLEKASNGASCVPLYTRSLPGFQNVNVFDVPYQSPSPSTMSAMGIHVNSGHLDGAQSRVGSDNLNDHYFHYTEAFPGSSNGSCSFHGYQFRDNLIPYHNHPCSCMIWPNCPSCGNSISTNLASELHRHPRAPSQMLNLTPPLHHPVVSAPSQMLNLTPPLHHPVVSAPSLWGRRHAYVWGSINSPAFHSGSLRNITSSGSCPLHPLELAHSMFPCNCGHCTNHSVSPVGVGLPSPQNSHMFQNSNMVPNACAFGALSDQRRRQRYGASQYELDINRVVRGEDLRTTLMIKNIPNKYTSKLLLAAIEEHHRGTYDFIYLPIDFKNKCNMGYAFINLTDPPHIIPFFKTFDGRKWEKFNSGKVASLAYARIQGKAALIAHFQNSSLMNEDKRYRPILFHSDGPNAGDQEPFPVGANIRARLSRTMIVRQDDHEQSLPNSPGRKESL